MVQTPPPPSISPRQMNLLRIVTAMAWSDGDLSVEEVDVMLDRFSQVFTTNESVQHQLHQELRDYLMQNVPLTELTPKLTSIEEKELVLRLGYEVIAASSRVPNESRINDDEAIAYRHLVEALALPNETVQRIESEVKAHLGEEPLLDSLTHQLEGFSN
jgi:hypothetical protein